MRGNEEKTIVFKIIERQGQWCQPPSKQWVKQLTLVFMHFSLEKESTLPTCLPRVPITALLLA